MSKKEQEVQITGLNNYLNKIQPVYDQLNKFSNAEFEIEFGINNEENKELNLINYPQYIQLLRFLNSLSNSFAVHKNSELTIRSQNYFVRILEDKNIYRLINKYSTFKQFLFFANTGVDYSQIGKQNIITEEEIPEFNAKIRVIKEDYIPPNSEEYNNILKKDTGSFTCTYQKKISVFFEDSPEFTYYIELISTAKNNNGLNSGLNSGLNNIVNNTIPKSYELKLKAKKSLETNKSLKTKKSLETNKSLKTKKSLETIIKRANQFLRLLEDSNYLMTNSEKEYVKSEYFQLINKRPMTKNDKPQLKNVNVVSFENTFLEYLSNSQYLVVEKIDGVRHFMVIIKNKVYFIDQNFNIKYSGHTLSGKPLGIYIFDGELVTHNNKRIFVIFDILYENGEDVENLTKIDRITKFMQFLDKYFNVPFDPKVYQNPEHNINQRVKLYQKQLNKHLDYVLQLINETKTRELPIIIPTFFMVPGCKDQTEIYRYSVLYWNTYLERKKNNSNYPYDLDGIVYHPALLPYNSFKLPVLKWKPVEINTIDFYIEFKRDSKNKIITVFDNTLNFKALKEDDTNQPNIISNVKYQICNLYVSRYLNSKETIPVLFNPPNVNNDIHEAYLKVETIGDGEYIVKDLEGNPITDKTVVEFAYYKNEREKFNWKPLRTRYDKTESVIKYHTKYGNGEKIVNRIWNSIINPIEFKHLQNLANPDTYQIQYRELTKVTQPIPTGIWKSQNDDDQLNKIMIPHKNFHNAIKTLLISNYCSPFNGIGNKRILSVEDLDGENIRNLYHAHIKNAVFVGSDQKIQSGINGALAQYNSLKAKHPGIPPMNFIIADFGVSLNYQDQSEAIELNKFFKLSNDDIREITKLSKSKEIFDVAIINSFESISSKLDQIMTNVSKLLKPNSLILFICFDKSKINKLINNSTSAKISVTVGNSNYSLFEVSKISENIYDIKTQNETLNNVTLLSKHDICTLLKKYNYVPIDTMNFKKSYDILKEYIIKISDVETKPEMKKFLIKLKNYYESQNNTIQEYLKLTGLYKFYVFQRN